jgi:DNA-binding NarL/FixJ family response regulator
LHPDILIISQFAGYGEDQSVPSVSMKKLGNTATVIPARLLIDTRILSDSMVLIITDPIERARWEEHQRMHCHSKQCPERIQEIIRLSKEGKSIPEIRKEVRSSFGNVSNIRTNARRQGLM